MAAARIIDGQQIARKTRASVASAVAGLSGQPGLAVILVGDDPASQVYVGKKIKTCSEVGIRSEEHRLSGTASAEEIAALITRLNGDKNVHGILLQLPLPKHLNADPLVQMIAPEKDVDGLTALNAGRLLAGIAGLVPCTPQGCMILLEETLGKGALTGKNAVVIGRSLLFGKPMGQLLLQADCTVTQAHSKTVDLKNICRQADILVAAVGRAEMVKGDWVKDGATVIDVGMNRLDDGRLTGDVAFDEVSAVAAHITPVPGGVGPMTVACLMLNCVKAYCLQSGQAMPAI